MPDGNLPLAGDSLLAHVTSLEQQLVRARSFVKRYLCPLSDSKINDTQMILLLRLPDRDCRVGDTKRLHVYNGENAEYNLKKLEEAGLITRQKTSGDRRFTIIRRTERGDEVMRRVNDQLSSNPTIRAELELFLPK